MCGGVDLGGIGCGCGCGWFGEFEFGRMSVIDYILIHARICVHTYVSIPPQMMFRAFAEMRRRQDLDLTRVIGVVYVRMHILACGN